jgi:epoxyqueuosine reductase QueG
MNDSIIREIIDFVADYQESEPLETQWLEPLVGFADAEDPLFARLHSAVGPTHAMPGDLLEGAQSVIAYFLPFEKSIAQKNKGDFYAAKEWALAYIETNQLIIDLNNHLSEFLAEKEKRCTVLPPTHNFDKKKLVSDWSHRHVAFIAGLGTFGLHNLLITERGCCGRIGSIITDAVCTPSMRPETEHCLYKYDKTCTACVKNCVVEALKVDSFDRQACYNLLLVNEQMYERYGKADACGKCTCVVPCSFQNPVNASREKAIKD